MKHKIGKEYKWEMSHRLPFHNGVCKNIHGHSYKMIVELIGDLDSNGMLIDFYFIDEIIRPFVMNLDHSFICDVNDEVILNFVKENKFKFNVIKHNSTAELLASNFAEEFKSKFSKFDNIETITVRLFETSDAYAEVSINLK